jgi:hypothetical protein
MSDVFDLEIRYKAELEQAKAFLSSEVKKAGRTPANPEQKQHFLNMNAECPLCGDPFHEGNHNTEHIFPIALGGKNTVDNRIQLCRMCNNSRNKVMQSSFFDNPRSIYPEKWPQIKRVLLWHIITIDDGVEAGTVFASTHDLFMMYATGGKKFPNRPKRAYGRFSTWGIGDEPNYSANQPTSTGKSNSQTNPSTTWRSFGRNLLDKFFLYEPKDNSVPIQIETDVIDVKPSIPRKSQSIQSPPVIKSVKKLPDDVDKDAFVNAIMKLVSAEEGSKFQLQTSFIGEVGRRIRIMQEADGWKEVGTRSFLLHHGFPGNFGLLNALKTCFGNHLEIIGEHPKQKVRILNQLNRKNTGDFPKIRGFNNASVGSMCFPHLPSTFALCMKDYHSNQVEIETTADIFNRFKLILGGKRRASALELRVSFEVLPPDTTYESKDWKEARHIDSPLILSEAIRASLIERAPTLTYQGSEIPNLIDHINAYFDIVKDLL